MENSKHIFRIRKGRWSVYIELSGRLELHDSDGQGSCGKIEVQYGENLSKERRSIIESGLDCIHKRLAHKIGNNATLHIKSLDYDPNHYQDEGLAPAVVEWLGVLADIEVPEVKVGFDREQNRYHFRILGDKELYL